MARELEGWINTNKTTVEIKREKWENGTWKRRRLKERNERTKEDGVKYEGQMERTINAARKNTKEKNEDEAKDRQRDAERTASSLPSCFVRISLDGFRQ